MARRRTSNASDLGGFLIVGGVTMAIAVALTILKALVNNPAIGIPVFLLAVLGLAIYIKARIDARRQAQAWAAEQHRIAVLRSMEIAPYHAMDAREFEQALAFLCERDGCRDVQVVGKAGDLGADVMAITPDGRRVVIQAKRYSSKKVGGPELQKFGGTCYNVHHAQVAAVVTTSDFTKQARQYADHMSIQLIGEDQLAGWASRTGPAPWH